MSYTTLRDVEICPLRWALRHAQYHGLWEGKGYPPSPAAGTAAGQVVHLALERIVRALSTARAEPVGADVSESIDPALRVVSALRSLGGISQLLEEAVREVVSGWEVNPRVRARAKELACDLRRQVPALRPRLQQFLGRVDVGRLRPGDRTSGTEMERDNSSPRPLRPGLYAEVPLVNEELGWYGKADLLRVGGGLPQCGDDEIVDFKTGVPKPDHGFQLRTYALLWARDTRRNPAGRPARKLTVMYGAESVDIPAPTTDQELEDVTRELVVRTAAVRTFVEEQPPVARPSRDACEWCDVKHMCSAYWAPDTRSAINSAGRQPGHQIDAGVRLVQRQGAWSWTALVREVGALVHDVAVGTSVLLRARPHDEHFASLFRVGDEVRIIGAQLVAPSDESGGVAVLSLSRSTEGYICP